MYKAEELSVLAYANGFTLWHYRTEEDNIEEEGYFEAPDTVFNEGDMIMANTKEGGNVYIVTAVKPKVKIEKLGG